ncbi:MAG: exodeoxyribonuclease VII large subunit [Eubacterium sp.]|nr:exodeoxyribonuclease VII large subunit [Eubacterium sp.]
MNTIYSVSQINSYIKNMFAQDFMLQRISVSGEVSNCTYHRSGHIYFTLKDASSAISCIMFASARRGLGFRMKEGDRVVVTGAVDVYERDGRYQLYANKIEMAGAGLLYEKFLRLKRELEEMGMFDPMYKQPIPAYVRKLGIVTAPTGAAVQDIRNISIRRNPYVQLILYPALVQGEGAAASIVRGIETLDRMGLDCIIVGRGGGSIEDLWAFNEEAVARAIFACRTPVISAVGHETDTTIADFVADLRAPTPSAAAELAVADIQSVLQQLSRAERRLQMAMAGRVQSARDALARRAAQWNYLSPGRQIDERRRAVAELETRMRRALEETIRRSQTRAEMLRELLPARMQLRVTEQRHRLQLLVRQYQGLSPLARLEQGYAKAEREDGTALVSVRDISAGDVVRIYVRDGKIDAVAERTALWETDAGTEDTSWNR